MIDLDRAHFTNLLAKIAKLERKSTSDIHRQETRLAVEFMMRATAPMNFGREFTEAIGQQKKLGERAVDRDVRRVFYDKPEGDLAKAALRVMRKNGSDAANRILDRAGASNIRASETPTRALHRVNRGAGGRVKRRVNPQVVVKSGLASYARASKAKVGYTKAGWARALVALGAGVKALPAWVSRHSAPGNYYESGVGTGNETLTAVNMVKWIRESPGHTAMASRVVAARKKFLVGRLRKAERVAAKAMNAVK
jgi:hypothetical protein